MKGKIYVVGIGPGNEEYMTPQAKKIIETADVVAGYDLYVDMVRDICDGREIISTPMKQEAERCRLALEKAEEGKTVAFVSGGDAGVYGMAGLMLEIAEGRDVEVVTVPGITAACSGAAALGAPLIHDFAVISLSDLLTPMADILKRIRLAAEADFVICIYNPRSRKRRDHLDMAVREILAFRSPDTPCGYVRNIGREGEKVTVCRLDDLPGNDAIDMFTTVFIGKSTTKVIDGKLVTPRGYDVQTGKAHE